MNRILRYIFHRDHLIVTLSAFVQLASAHGPDGNLPGDQRKRDVHLRFRPCREPGLDRPDRPVSVFAAHGYGPVLLAASEIIELCKSL